MKKTRLACLPCVFCGRAVAWPADCPAGPEAFAVCRDDDARLDTALATLAADVRALLDARGG